MYHSCNCANGVYELGEKFTGFPKYMIYLLDCLLCHNRGVNSGLRQSVDTYTSFIILRIIYCMNLNSFMNRC